MPAPLKYLRLKDLQKAADFDVIGNGGVSIVSIARRSRLNDPAC